MTSTHTPSPGRCLGTTARGHPCRARPQRGGDYCLAHRLQTEVGQCACLRSFDPCHPLLELAQASDRIGDTYGQVQQVDTEPVSQFPFLVGGTHIHRDSCPELGAVQWFSTAVQVASQRPRHSC